MAIFFHYWLLRSKTWARRTAPFLSSCFGRLACLSVGSSDLSVIATSPTAFFLFEKSFQPRPTHSRIAFLSSWADSLASRSFLSHPPYPSIWTSNTVTFSFIGRNEVGSRRMIPGPEIDPGTSDGARKGD